MPDTAQQAGPACDHGACCGYLLCAHPKCCGWGTNRGYACCEAPAAGRLPGRGGECGLRGDVTPEAVATLRLAADNMPIARTGQPWEGAADWLRRRADAFEAALAGAEPGAAGRTARRVRRHDRRGAFATPDRARPLT